MCDKQETSAAEQIRRSYDEGPKDAMLRGGAALGSMAGARPDMGMDRSVHRSMDLRQQLFEHASLLRLRANQLEALARALPGEMSLTAEEGLNYLMVNGLR